MFLSTDSPVWRIEDLLDLHGLPFSKSGIQRLNRLPRVLEPDVFRSLAKMVMLLGLGKTGRRASLKVCL